MTPEEFWVLAELAMEPDVTPEELRALVLAAWRESQRAPDEGLCPGGRGCLCPRREPAPLDGGPLGGAGSGS